MTTLSKDEVVKMAREAGAVFDPRWGVASNTGTATFERFVTLCRAPLVAEVERLEQWHAEMADNRNAIASERDTLKAELEQAKKDAARYRWLVSQPNGGFFHPVFAVNSLLSWKSKAQYDAAIDAAIVKEQS